jgi:hypothetical protein
MPSMRRWLGCLSRLYLAQLHDGLVWCTKVSISFHFGCEHVVFAGISMSKTICAWSL